MNEFFLDSTTQRDAPRDRWRLRPTGTSGQASEIADVLHVIQPGDVGGAETVVRALAAAQRARGGRVAVAAIVHDDSSAGHLLDGLGGDLVEVHRVQITSRAYARERTVVRAICRSVSPDVVHTHGYRADIIDGLALRRRAAIVTTVHGYTGGGLKNRIYEALQRRAFQRFDAVVAVSKPLARDLTRSVGPERIHIVPNGIARAQDVVDRCAARAALGVPAEGFTIGWVGRMSPEKGADVLLDALAHPEAPSDAHTAFIGDGPELESLKRRAQRLGVDSRVSWAGRIPDASRYFAAFDVFVLSSRTEGTPMVVLEAMAAGTPIVATRVGGVPDVVPTGTALLVPSESPAELAHAISTVFRNSGVARSMASSARRRLDAEHGVANWVAQYDRVYGRALTEARRRLR